MRQQCVGWAKAQLARSRASSTRYGASARAPCPRVAWVRVGTALHRVCGDVVLVDRAFAHYEYVSGNFLIYEMCLGKS